MIYIKKLLFAPLFLASFGYLVYSLQSLFSSPLQVLSLSLDNFVYFLILTILLILSSLFFIIFTTIANEWVLISLIIALGAVFPLIMLPFLSGLILGLGFLVTSFISYVFLSHKLQTYLNFQPTALFTPSIKSLATMILVVICLVFYLATSDNIKQDGFQVPDSLINSILKFSNLPQNSNNSSVDSALSQITPDQIALLKQNPQLLQQYGVDPKILDSLDKTQSKSTSSPQDLLKSTIKAQINTTLKPYQSYIPIFLTVTLFFTFEFFRFFVSLLISPVVWIIFYGLEKSQFIKFVTEQREVKKMVV